MRRVLLAICLALFALPALAQSPAPDPNTDPFADWDAWIMGGPQGERDMPPPLGPFNYVREFDQIVEFLAAWQLLDPDSTDYGGMIEAEDGYLGDVIQTDNTLEAIWCWSRYREFSGRDTYDDNIDAAWVYCTNFPAWEEEGSAGDNYYRAHNCAWGLTAVLKYKDATGDDSYDWYAETCAQYIMDNPLNIWDGTVWQQRLDLFVKGWCAGNLSQYATALADPTMQVQALAQGWDVHDYLNVDPPNRLNLEYWAMSSGTALWGVCETVFDDQPIYGRQWLSAYGNDLQTWQDWYSVPGYDWDSAWNVAYANAQFAVSDVEGNPNHAFFGALITDALLSYDTDDDGGIVAESTDPVTEDMSWVTCYLCKFGVDRMMRAPGSTEPPGLDVGVLGFHEPRESADQMWVIGDTLRWKVLASNYGVQDAVGVELHFAGGGMGNGMTMIDIDFARVDTVIVAETVIEYAGWYHMEAWTVLPGDENSANDSFYYELYVNESTDLPESTLGGFRVSANPFVTETEFRFNLSAEENLRLDIFDVTGRRVDTVEAGRRGAGEHRLVWKGRDLPAGLYLYRLETSKGVESGRVVKLK